MSTEKARVVHYINHFFAGVGGEEKAGHTVDARKGPVGPGQALQSQMAGKGEIVLTVFCGDNYIAESPEDARKAVNALILEQKPDVLVAGPAFNAGRYGYACVEVCEEIASSLGIPGVTALYPDNPAVEVYRQYKNDKVYALPAGETAASMAGVIAKMATFALRLAAGEAIGPAQQEGYFSRGLRRPALAQESGAVRAINMLMTKMADGSYTTEIPLGDFEYVRPAPPLGDLAHAKIALISTSGVVPKGNPDRFRSGSNTFWKNYSYEGLGTMSGEKWESAHGGYDTAFMNRNPNFGVPLDVLRELEDGGAFGSLEPYFFSVPGNGMHVKEAKRMGKEMAEELKKSGANGVLLVST